MMHIIQSSNLASVIESCFLKDEALITTYHIESGSSLKACVARTLKDLNTTDSSFRFYEIKDEDELIGFFGKEHSNYLTTIFVRPDYRNKTSMNEIWNLIKSAFDTEFYTAVYAKNTRAASFYSKNGTLVDEFTANNKDKALAFKFTNEVI